MLCALGTLGRLGHTAPAQSAAHGRAGSSSSLQGQPAAGIGQLPGGGASHAARSSAHPQVPAARPPRWAPSHCAGLDLPKIEPHIDTLYLMAYDMHGSWEKQTGFNTPWEDPSVSRALTNICLLLMVLRCL